MSTTLTIGKLAKAAGVGIETIRFYERKQLIKQPLKKGAFRYYSPDLITRIQFIKRSQELGFTLKEAKELLDLKIKNKSKCDDILKRTEQKIYEIKNKINDLNRMRRALEDLADCCDSKETPLSECPILDCFINKEKK